MTGIVEPQPSVYPFGIRIDEPMAVVTDLLVSVVSLYAWWHMRHLNTWSQIHLRRYFLMVAAATAWGGIMGHGFLYAFTFSWKLPGWILGIISVALVERSAISHAQPLIKPGIGRFFLVLNIVEMIAVLIINVMTMDFKWVEYHNAYGLLVNVAGFHGYTWYRTRDRGSFIMLVGVAVTSVASIVFTWHISLHTWLNYIDLSHIIIAIACYITFQGGIRLETKGRTKRLTPEKEEMML